MLFEIFSTKRLCLSKIFYIKRRSVDLCLCECVCACMCVVWHVMCVVCACACVWCVHVHVCVCVCVCACVCMCCRCVKKEAIQYRQVPVEQRGVHNESTKSANPWCIGMSPTLIIGTYT